MELTTQRAHVAAIDVICSRSRTDSELVELNARGHAVVSQLLLANPSFALVPATGWRSVHVDRERSTIRLRPGTELDLGATAKALAADLAVAGVLPADGLATSSTTVRRRRAGRVELHRLARRDGGVLTLGGRPDEAEVGWAA